MDDLQQQFLRQLDSAMRAKERNKGAPRRRPTKDREETLQMFSLKIMQQSMDAMKFREGGTTAMKTTITSGESPCCKKPLDELTPITFSEMMAPQVHYGRYLTCRTVTDPLPLVGTTAIVEDLNGDVEELALYNFRFKLDDASWLPRGSILVIKEPYLKYASMCDTISMRVDSPSDVIIVDETDQKLLSKIGGLKWHKPEELTVEKLRKMGNASFVNGNYESALRCYNRALRLNPDDAVIHLNRAATLLQLEFFFEAHKAAKAAYDGGANKEKALYRLGKAAYGMRNWEDAAAHFTALLRECPENKDAKGELQRTLSRLKESRTGVYDLRGMYHDAITLKKHYLDVADYTGPVEVVDVPGKGKGIVATEDVPKGTLLMASKAFACTYADDYSGLILSTNLITKQADKKTQFLNRVRIAQTLLRNPQRAAELYSLYAGDLSRDELIPEGVIDVARIEQISSFNSFKVETKSLDGQQRPMSDAEQLLSKTPTALFTLPSFFNHSCIGNAYRSFYGDVMMVRAACDLKKGEEVTLPYFDSIASLPEREQKLQKYKIRCDCRLCQLDRADTKSQERAKLAKKCEELKLTLHSNPQMTQTSLKRLIKQIRQSYGTRKELRVELFHPLHLLARAYLPFRNLDESANALKECLDCLEGALYYTHAPEVCSQIVLCLQGLGRGPEADACMQRARDAACIRAGIDEGMFGEIMRTSELKLLP